MTIQYGACILRVSVYTRTHSEYAIFIAFSRQHWLCEFASVLRYTYIGCVVISPCHFRSHFVTSFTHVWDILFQRFGGKIPSCGYALWDSEGYRIGTVTRNVVKILLAPLFSPAVEISHTNNETETFIVLQFISCLRKFCRLKSFYCVVHYWSGCIVLSSRSWRTERNCREVLLGCLQSVFHFRNSWMDFG
jgi:hypothetical protein